MKKIKDGYFITGEGLVQLKNYRYVSGEYSWLDRKMNPFWEWVALQLPMWLAPNLVTFVGFVLIASCMVLVMLYDLTFRGLVPGWVFALSAANLFIYWTLDAVDGKQARRTGSSSPLGQLFDHGCDSFSIGFLILVFLEAGHVDFNWAFFVLTVIQSGFYIANFTENVTGVLSTQYWNIGVSELTVIEIIFLSVTAAKGQSFWNFALISFLPGPLATPLEMLPLIPSLTPLIIIQATAVFLLVIAVYLSSRLLLTYRLRAVRGLLPLVWLQGLELVFFFFVGFFEDCAILVLLGFVMLLSLVITKMIICSLTKMRLLVLHPELLLATLMTAVVLALQHLGLPRAGFAVFAGWFVLDLLLIVRFVALTIGQITQFLAIRCFSIVKKE